MSLGFIGAKNHRVLLVDGTQQLSTRSQRRVIFSGIQPTGTPHLGNYIGAISRWVRLQDEDREAKLLYSIVDLHAITTPQPSGQLAAQRRETLAALVACGLQPSRCSIFYQSSVPAHTELMWILACQASVGYLSRMTQWKSKLAMSDSADFAKEDIKARLKLGLFSYPVLQAADILIHRASHVPVGHDQRQHLEFARECVTNFNHTYGQVLVSPETMISPIRRIMSLRSPAEKMSKSDPNTASRILITDRPEEIHKKVMAAITDSDNSVTYQPTSRHGVSNLLEILSFFDDFGRGPEALAESLRGATLRDLKFAVAQAVVKGFDGIGDKHQEIMSRGDGKYLDSVEQEGANVARSSAEETMRAVRNAIGFRSR